MNEGMDNRGAYERGQLMVEFNEFFARRGAREVVIDGLMWVMRGGLILSPGHPYHGFKAIYNQAIAPSEANEMVYRVDLQTPKGMVQIGYCQHGGQYLSSLSRVQTSVPNEQYAYMRQAVLATSVDPGLMEREAASLRERVGDLCVNQLYREFPDLTPRGWADIHGPSSAPCDLKTAR